MNSDINSSHRASVHGNARNMKIHQLSELGLEFFDNDLDGETLALNLLNQDSLSSISGVNSNNLSKDPVVVDFSNLDDYVSGGIMGTPSSEQQHEPVITASSVTNERMVRCNDLLVKHVAEAEYRNATLNADLNSVDDLSPSIAEKKTINNPKVVENVDKPFSNLIFTILDEPDESNEKTKTKSKNISDIKVSVVSQDGGNDFFIPTNGKITIDNSKSDLFMNGLGDCSDLDNKINDSLLDMLQDKFIRRNTGHLNSFRSSNKPKSPEHFGEKEISKFMTIYPSKSTNKIINLMVKGKTCRSKQPLTDQELRIVTRILNQENSQHSTSSVYKNVFYDTESDCNIRYEVRRDVVPEENNFCSDVDLSKIKKGRPKHDQNSEEISQEASKSDAKYVLKSVARTRCGRVSRPPRHVIRDYKRLKHLTARYSDVEDENENTGGYADYQLVDDPTKQGIVNEKQKESENLLYGPLEPNKRQFSSLSICPTCGKVYLGYRRMAIHFQKYPEHKNEELLKRLLESKKKSFDETALSDSCEINAGKEVLVNGFAGRTNGTIKRKRKLCRKIKMPIKSNSGSLKELLAISDVDDIIKYAAPMIAGFLSSWEYFLIRSNKIKTEDETLASLLLKEVSSVLKQMRSLSHYLLKPYINDKENTTNKFVIEEGDMLRYVLGVQPGVYATSENETWTKEFYRYSNCFQNYKCNAESISLNSTISRVGNSTNFHYVEPDLHTNNSNIDEPNKQFYNGNQPSFPVLEFPRSQNVESNLNLSKSSLSSIVEEDSSNTNANPSNCDKATVNENCKPDFTNDDYDSASAPLDHTNNFNSIISSKRRLLTDDPNSSAYGTDALNFDSFVNNDVDIMNDFPISLPSLSDNSSDSKDCLHLLRTTSAEDLLNSLKTMEHSGESVMVELHDSIPSNLPLSTTRTDNLDATFGENVNTNNSSCILDFDEISSDFHCNE